jgi:hypothetical protein
MPCGHRTRRRPNVTHRVPVSLFAGFDGCVQSFLMSRHLVPALFVKFIRGLARLISALAHILAAVLRPIFQVFRSVARLIREQSARFFSRTGRPKDSGSHSYAKSE